MLDMHLLISLTFVQLNHSFTNLMQKAGKNLILKKFVHWLMQEFKAFKN